MQRDLDTGEIVEFREVPVDSVGANARNSMSFARAPAPPTESVRGSASYIPFQPGSFPEPILDLPKKNLLLDNSEWLTVPPGFSRGLTFAENGYTLVKDQGGPKSSTFLDASKTTINLLDLIHQEQDLLGKFSCLQTMLLLRKLNF